MSKGQGGGISKPNPFNLHVGYVDLTGLNITLDNNQEYQMRNAIGTAQTLLKVSGTNQVLIGATGLGEVFQYMGAASNYILRDGTNRLIVDSNHNFLISGSVRPTALTKGMVIPKGTNPTANPADGFSINADATNGFPYVRDENGNKGRLSLIKTGTYTGDGTTGQAITGVGFTPKSIFINEDGASATDLGKTFVSNNEDLSNYITAIGADGFTVSDIDLDLPPNTNGVTYHYTCLG